MTSTATWSTDMTQTPSERIPSETTLSQQGGSAHKPTPAFVGASWAALGAGTIAFCVGLWNARMQLSEKGFYLTVLMFGLFAAVSLQKSVRDKMEGIEVSPIYFGLSWVAVGAALILLTVGLWNAVLLPSEKGFYAMSFVLSLFAAVTVQKNVRDLALAAG
jgi:uncharacterized membrane protein YiaA